MFYVGAPPPHPRAAAACEIKKGKDMGRTDNLKNREVVNIDTAERMGVVSDVEIDAQNGRITSLVVRRNGIRSLIGGELVIPWGSIAVIGKEIILVRVLEISKQQF